MESAAEGSPAGSDGLSSQDLAAIDDEEVLNKMLDEAVDFEERRKLRAALRDLLKKKREKREKERGSRQQDLKQQGLAKTGTTNTSSIGRGTTNQTPTHKPSSQSSSSFSSSSSSSSSSPGPFNRTAGSQASPSAAAVTCPAPAASAAPNLRNVKHMLLEWCKAKTQPYEGVNIRDFSSSWSDGIAFCALVHRFFPDAFEYYTLNPTQRRENFQLAFSTAERLADCPPLLDVEDLVRMPEPDWKCVYTYIQEFYRCLVDKGLVKTKKKA